MHRFLFLFFIVFSSPGWTADPPNIVFVYTDDQARWDMGCSGNPEAHTPNMDRFFGEGATLDNCFAVTPVCSPARASLMTSRYGTELGITDWIHPQEEPDLGLAPEYSTWPKVLHEAGYRTCMVGKWHLGTAPRYHPLKNGFDVFRGFLEGGIKVKDAVFEVDGKSVQAKGLTVDFLTDRAIDFLNEEHGNQPFLLCVHYRSPHAPWLPVWSSDWEPYADLDPTIPNPDYPDLDTELVKKKMREYMASTTGVDYNFGRILRQLDNLGLSENTVVIFTSDHGYNMGHNGIWHKGNGHWITKSKRHAKWEERQRPNMYDNSIRVPAAIRWPGKIQKGTHVRETIHSLDWYPSLLSIAGVEAPEGTLIRGRDFSPLLTGEEVKDWNNDLFGQYSQHHSMETHLRMYRTPEFKLVRDYKRDGFDEFYDLRFDPEEHINLIGSETYRETIAELDKKLVAEMEKIGDLVYKK